MALLSSNNNWQAGDLKAVTRVLSLRVLITFYKLPLQIELRMPYCVQRTLHSMKPTCWWSGDSGLERRLRNAVLRGSNLQVGQIQCICFAAVSYECDACKAIDTKHMLACDSSNKKSSPAVRNTHRPYECHDKA